MNETERQKLDEYARAMQMLSRSPITTAGMSLVEAVRAVLTAHTTADAVVRRARTALAEWDERSRFNFGPVRRAVLTYDAITGPARERNEQAAELSAEERAALAKASTP